MSILPGHPPIHHYVPWFGHNCSEDSSVLSMKNLQTRELYWVCQKISVLYRLGKDPGRSMHYFPRDSNSREMWIKEFTLDPTSIKVFHKVCWSHFLDADPHKRPDLALGKHFASWADWAKRAKECEVFVSYFLCSIYFSRAIVCSTLECEDVPVATNWMPHTSPERSQVIVHTALLTIIEVLETENKHWKKAGDHRFISTAFMSNDRLIKLYTGFPSYEVLLAFYEFLGPVVDNIQYWGEREYVRKPQHKRKLSLFDQLFLTLTKLKLELCNEDLGIRFRISESLVSRYISTWICFSVSAIKGNRLDNISATRSSNITSCV